MNFSYESNKKSVPLVILLSFITCGIYPIYWMYDTTRRLAELNRDDSINPGLSVLFSIITCGIYSIYWWYKLGEMFVESQARQDVYPIVDNKILFLLLSIFGLSIVSVLILQSDLNRFWEKLDTYEQYR
jgi:hypothetical protein